MGKIGAFFTRGKKASQPISNENVRTAPATTKPGAVALQKPLYKVQQKIEPIPPRQKSETTEPEREAVPEKPIEEEDANTAARVSTSGNGISCGFHHVVPGIQMQNLFEPKVLTTSALPTPCIGGPQLGIQAPFQYQTGEYSHVEIPEPKLLRSGALTLPRLLPPGGLLSQPMSVAAEIPMEADVPEAVEGGEIEEFVEPVEALEPVEEVKPDEEVAEKEEEEKVEEAEKEEVVEEDKLDEEE